MGHDKLIKRLKSVPADFTFSELETLLGWLNYKRHNKGSTSGSRVLFYRESDNSKISLHKSVDAENPICCVLFSSAIFSSRVCRKIIS